MDAMSIADFGGRPAVLVALWDQRETLASVHGRYLHTERGQNKMLTIGPGGGLLSVRGGWRVDLGQDHSGRGWHVGRGLGCGALPGGRRAASEHLALHSAWPRL